MIKSAYADRGNIKSGSHTKIRNTEAEFTKNERKCRSTKIQNTGVQDTGEYKNMAIQIQE